MKIELQRSSGVTNIKELQSVAETDEDAAAYLEFLHLEELAEQAYVEYWSQSHDYSGDKLPNYDVEQTMEYEHPDREDDSVVIYSTVGVGKPWKSKRGEVSSNSSKGQLYQQRAKQILVGYNDTLGEDTAIEAKVGATSKNHHLEDFPQRPLSEILEKTEETDASVGLVNRIKKVSKRKTSRPTPVAGIIYSSKFQKTK